MALYVVCQLPPEPNNMRLNMNVVGCFPRPIPCSAAMIGSFLPLCSKLEYCSPNPYIRSSGVCAYLRKIWLIFTFRLRPPGDRWTPGTSSSHRNSNASLRSDCGAKVRVYRATSLELALKRRRWWVRSFHAARTSPQCPSHLSSLASSLMSTPRITTDGCASGSPVLSSTESSVCTVVCRRLRMSTR